MAVVVMAVVVVLVVVVVVVMVMVVLVVASFSPWPLVDTDEVISPISSCSSAGANSALMDVVALDKCLDECNDDVPAALRLFSARQVGI